MKIPKHVWVIFESKTGSPVDTFLSKDEAKDIYDSKIEEIVKYTYVRTKKLGDD